LQRMGWARLLKRVFDTDLQRCPRCGGVQVTIIEAILERAVIGKMLTHLVLDPRPPARSKAREAGLRALRWLVAAPAGGLRHRGREGEPREDARKDQAVEGSRRAHGRCAMTPPVRAGMS
jgi:hypothetical protein